MLFNYLRPNLLLISLQSYVPSKKSRFQHHVYRHRYVNLSLHCFHILLDLSSKTKYSHPQTTKAKATKTTKNIQLDLGYDPKVCIITCKFLFLFTSFFQFLSLMLIFKKQQGDLELVFIFFVQIRKNASF